MIQNGDEMAWRSPSLEAIFGGPLDETGITHTSIDRLIAEGTTESDQLDFKGTPYAASQGPRGGWTDEQEFAKDVAAFANHRGGVILVGVKERDGIATKAAPFPLATSTEAEERRLRQALTNYQAPLANCGFVWVRSPGGDWHLAIIVPPSSRAPHAVLGPRNDPRPTLRYPVRHGTDTIWLSEHEVAARYRRRLTAERDEKIRVERVLDDGSQAILRSSGIWLYVAAVPEAAIEVTLDTQTVQRIDDWHRSAGIGSPLGRHLPAYGRGIPAPGRVTFTGSRSSDHRDETEIREAYVALYVDGAAFAALPVGQRSQDDPNRQIGEITLVDDAILLVDRSIEWCAHEVGAWGTATIVCGLVDADTDEGALTKPVELATWREGSDGRRIPGTRSVSGRPRGVVMADLASVGTVQQRLAAAHNVVAGLLQWFGMAEPKQLRPDGSIVPAEFTMSRYRDVEQWASGHDVTVHSLPNA